ncbi:hypothetical protein BDN67DRAFT_1002549 [Paxillus ammoniavirescens]|nr:hypothetical protein BDN67DRAFT_1002549 [Paxillus ammoniavirescens]
MSLSSNCEEHRVHSEWSGLKTGGLVFQWWLIRILNVNILNVWTWSDESLVPADKIWASPRQSHPEYWYSAVLCKCDSHQNLPTSRGLKETPKKFRAKMQTCPVEALEMRGKGFVWTNSDLTEKPAILAPLDSQFWSTAASNVRNYIMVGRREAAGCRREKPLARRDIGRRATGTETDFWSVNTH